MTKMKVQTDANGFTVRAGQSHLADWLGRRPTSWGVAWSEIEEVVGGKRDDFTVDTYYLDCRLSDGRRFLVTEDVDGWMGLLEAAHRALHGFPEPRIWLAQTMQPAFAPNVGVLCRREAVPR